MLFHEEIVTIIRAEEVLRALRDQHLACIRDALMVGTRVVNRTRHLTAVDWSHLDGLSHNAKAEAHQGTSLNRALVEAMWDARGWR